MAKRCYYEVLGVARACSEVELKGAFRKQAMQTPETGSRAIFV